MAEIKKQIYVSKENLQKVLEFLKTQNETLYLRKGAEAVSAAKVKNALTLTVGDTDVVFDGSEAKSTAVAAKVHNHTASNISDFDGAVKKVVFGNQNTQGTVTAHKHDNLEALNMVTVQYVKDWNAKIGVDDVAKLKYANDAMEGVADVKTAIDVLVKNIQIGSAAISATTANVNGLADRLTQAEKDIDQAEKDIDALEGKVGDASSGLIKDVADLKASVGADGTVTSAIKEAKDAADAAQASANAAQTTANEAKAAVATEQSRAEGEEAKLAGRLDVVQGTGDGSIAKALEDAKTYAKAQADGKDTAITAAKNAADAAQADVDALKDVVGEATDGAEANTVFGKIAKAQAQADKGVSDATAEAGRAKDAEKALDNKIKAETEARTSGDNALDGKITAEVERATAAEGALDAKITANKSAIDTLKGNADTPGSVANAVKKEETRALAAEKAIDDKAKANKAAIDILNGGVNQAGSVDKKIADKIAEVNQAASSLEGRVAANEDAIATLNGDSNTEGSVRKAIADIVGAAPENMDTLKELADAITAHQSVYEAYVNTVNGQIATAKEQAITEAGKNADTKDQALHTTITDEIATAKSEAIAAASSDASSKDDALKAALQANIDEKVDQSAYDTKIAALEKADTDNLAAAIKHADDEDAKIEAILGHKATEDGLTATGLCKDVADNAAAIAKEAEDREAADEALSARIDELTGDGAGSIAAQVKEVQDDLDAFKTAQGTKDETQDASISANAAAIDGVKGRLDTAEGKLDTIQGTGEGSFKKAVADAKSDIKVTTDALDGRINGLDTRVGALEATVNTATTGLKARMEVAESNINTLESNMAIAQADITNIQNTLLNLVPLSDVELQTMLDQVYAK